MKDKQIKYGVILSYIYIIINFASGLLFTPFLIRTLGNSQYGLYEIIVALASNLSILNLGMSDCIVKYVSTYRTDGNKRKQGEVIGCVLKILTVSAILAAFICIGLYIKFDAIYAASLTPDELECAKRLFILSSVNLIFSLPGGVFSCVLTAYEKFAATRGLNIIRILLRILLIIIGVGFSATAMTILLIDTALNVLLILVNYILVKRWLEVKIVLNVSDKTLYKKIFTFSGYTIFFIVAKEVQWQTDKTIIGLRLNTAMVTIYAAGAKVSSMFNQLGYTLSGMFLPRAIRIKEESNKEEDYRNYMVSMGRMILPPVLGVMIAYAFMGKSFMRLWMGEGFDLAFYSSIIMMGAVFIPMLEDTGLAILKARDKQAGVALTWLFSSIANIVLTWVTVPRFGIVAASVMTFVTSYLGNVLVMNFILKKEIGLHIFKLFRGIFRESWKLIFVSCLYFVIIYCMGITINSWLTFVIVGALFVVLYGITYIYSFLNKEQRYHLTNQIKKRKERKNGRNYNCN